MRLNLKHCGGVETSESATKAIRRLAGTAAAVPLALAAILAATGPIAPAAAQDATLELNDFYAFPEDASRMNKLEGYVWPAVESLSALVRVTTAGYSGERDVELFFAAKDMDGKVLSKIKQKHPLPAGTHELIVPDFVRTGEYFGHYTVNCELELTMKGAQVRRGQAAVDFSGPDPPEVEVHAVQVFNPIGGYRDTYFEPGDTFMVEAAIEIGDNPTGARPTITVYGVMDEDVYITNPNGDYLTYDKQWDSVKAEYPSGQFRLRATGWLPHFFAEPWDYYHPFKVYVLVSFGPGADFAGFAEATLFDPVGGDVRYTDLIEDRLIEISPGYNWEFRRGREPFDELGE